jgi:hypothetical protein
MNRLAMIVVLIASLLLAESASSQPTKLPLPAGAKDVQEIELSEGGAHETYFKIDVPYPENPALEHYKAIVKKPWVRCSWIPVWESFIDGTSHPPRTVYQQATVWINRDTKRTLMVSSQYSAPEKSGERPDNNDQKVVVIEYMHQDVDKIIATLKLQCPEFAMRSNPTPHADARDTAAGNLNSPAARAGGRER